jgi:hypothetical protein
VPAFPPFVFGSAAYAMPPVTPSVATEIATMPAADPRFTGFLLSIGSSLQRLTLTNLTSGHFYRLDDIARFY